MSSLTFPQSLRPTDAVAKTAMVTLKDTIRVIISLEAVLEKGGVSFEEFMNIYREQLACSPASELNAEACEEFYAHINSGERGGQLRRRLGCFVSGKHRSRLISDGRIS